MFLSGALVAIGVALYVAIDSPFSTADSDRAVFDAEREVLLTRIEQGLDLSSEQAGTVRDIVLSSAVLSQGNPKRTVHPMTREECQKRRQRAPVLIAGDSRCVQPHMVPVFDPARGQSADTAPLCVDQYEFPNLPCEYPLVHVTAREAALLCEAIGKRLCDAHEWEGACAGALRPPEREYAFGQSRSEMTRAHNRGRERVWAYGATKRHELCATGSSKTLGCGGGFARCGSNTYPAGAFPECVSEFGVYDQHGNVAEHMNLPSCPEELGGQGGLGHTEMKGSWFIFGSFEAHEDDCRWRAPNWHPSRVRDVHSHSNYHLGFRCCLDLEPSGQSRDGTSEQQRNPVE